MQTKKIYGLVLAVLLATLLAVGTQAQKAADTTAAKEGILKADEVGGKLFPDKVFFRGQVSAVQARNSGGVRFADQFLVMAAVVDNSGYSSALKAKYQAYLITEVPLDLGGKVLKPGAYAFGFLEGDKLLIMDLGANDLLQAKSAKDTVMKRPMPLQFTAGSAAGTYRLYIERGYIEFKRAK